MQVVKSWKTLCVAAGLLATSSLTAFAADPLKVAFVYLGPRGDGGWTQQHDMGRLGLEKAMGDKIKTTFVENVPETADSERVFRQLAADGNKLIFATSFGYMEPLQKVAKLFPDVKFEHVNGFKTAANISRGFCVGPRPQQGRELVLQSKGLCEIHGAWTRTLNLPNQVPLFLNLTIRFMESR